MKRPKRRSARSRTSPGKTKPAAERAALRKRIQSLQARAKRLSRELGEARDEQKATAEILRVISGSPTDVQPVLDAMAEAAARLCAGNDAGVFRLEGDGLRMMAYTGVIAAPANLVIPVIRGTVGGRSVLDRKPIQVVDLPAQVEEYPEGSRIARELGHRTSLSVPLLREGVAIGVIQLRRAEARPFTDKEIALLQTFASQAVIAIENTRLFTELGERNRDLTEALEQQTATSEILRTISSSPTELQPVFDTIVRNAVTLCDAAFGGLQQIRGDRMTLDAHCGVSAEEVAILQRDVFPVPITRQSATGRSVVDRAVVHIHDIREDPEFGLRRLQTLQGFRTILAVPMLREGAPIGALALWRREVRPFSDAEIGLVRTFADQAVIAIENVRLFSELQASNRDLTETLDKQTATSEILRVISASPTDARPVFEAIVASAGRLCGAESAVVYRFEADAVDFVASYNFSPETVGMYRRRFPRPLSETEHLGEVAGGSLVNIGDIERARGASPEFVAIYRARGVRSMVWVPMLRAGRAIGAINVAHHDVDAFSDARVQLLQTFADQAVIAVENTRLFHEIEDKGRQLEAASRHKSEFLANMSHELRTPLNAIIGFSEILAERMFGEVNDKQAEYLHDILESGRHLLSLINDILDLSKIEAGRMELDAGDFDLPAAIDDALILVRERATRHGIALGREIDGRLGAIHGDARKVKQVLLNLLSNALKFTPEGGRVDVRAVVSDGTAEVSVSDTGIGIAAEDQEAVFEEFRQVGTASKKIEGTGLGLALSRKFIELHGGRIWVKSVPGAGATFTFTLPLTSAPTPPA